MSRPELDIEHVLADALFQEYESWDKDGRIWPSDLGAALGPPVEACQAEFLAKCQNAPQNFPPPGVILMFKMGDLIEGFLIDLLEKYLPEHGWEVESKQESVEVFGIRGRSDVVLKHTESGYRVVIDVKSKRGGAFRYLTEPKPGNVLQVKAYAAGENADEGGVLYADREGQNFVRYFSVERNDDHPKNAVDILTQIRDGEREPAYAGLTIARRENKGPDAVYLNVPWQVEWCSLKTCLCKERLPGTPPDGIVARISNDGVVSPTKGNEKWLSTVVELLRQDYPNETFTTEG